MTTWFFYVVNSPDDGGWYFHCFEYHKESGKKHGEEHTSKNIWDDEIGARIAAIDWLDRHEYRWIELDPIK